MNKYELRLKVTPSLPTIVTADKIMEINGWFKFTVDSDIVFMVAMGEVLSVKVTKDAS